MRIGHGYDVHKLVEGRARNGRFACRFVDNRTTKGNTDLEAELYRASRIQYAK